MRRFKSSLNHIYHKLTQKWTLIGVFGIVAALSWIAVFASATSNELKVYFLDVGQGDAIFIELPDDRQILIDGGPDNGKVLERINSIMPFWDRSIDIVIATHGELDHIGGLRSVLRYYDVATIIWNGIESETKIFKEWKEAVDSEGATVLVGEYGMRFTLFDSVFFEIIYPLNTSWSDPVATGSDQERLSSQNNFSLVIRFVYGEDSFLFSGDIERQAEYKIIEQNLRIDSDVLKIAHHGSKTSSSELFLEKVNPKIAVISSGQNNTYGHPHEAILQRLTKYGIEIRRTDTEGTVLLITNGNSF
jgi:competence protein ComEC